MLSTWDRVKDHIGARYRVARSGDGWLQLVWRYEVEEGQPILQVAEITRTETAEGPWLRVLARVADHRALDASSALLLNFSLVVGRLARHRDDIVLVHYLPLAAVEAGELHDALERIPEEAARLRHALSGGYETSAPLVGYAD